MQFRHIIPCINRTAPYIIITVQSHKMFHKLSSKFLIPDLLSRLKEGIQANKCKQLNRIKRLFLFFIKMNFHCKLNKHTLTGIYRKQVLLYSIVVFRQSRIPASENDDTQNFNFGCKRWKTNHKSSLSAFFFDKQHECTHKISRDEYYVTFRPVLHPEKYSFQLF